MIAHIRRRAAVVLMVFGVALGIPLGVLATHQFSDVPTGASFHDDVEALVNAGITTGCGENTYCPGNPVTRGQMAQFLNRLGNLDGNTPPSVDADELDGLDSSDFIQGVGGAFAPNGTVDLGDVVDPDESRVNLGTITGLGSFTLGGAFLGPGEDCDITFTNESGGPVSVNGAANPGLADGASVELTGTGARPDGRSVMFSIATPNASIVASGEVVLTFGFPGGSTVCSGAVHALVTG